ncbi:MAG: hypothetical protein HOY76_38610 [Streptomyces sp.]|nr:hypothetical protein [Streptomyces sp.]
MTFRGLSYTCEKERACGICPAPGSAYADALEREVVGRWLNVVMALEPTDALAVKIAERWTALTLPEETEEVRGAREAERAAWTPAQPRPGARLGNAVLELPRCGHA